jgi:hypothetical protein
MRLEPHREVLDDPFRIKRLRRAQGLRPDGSKREGHRGRDQLLFWPSLIR